MLPTRDHEKDSGDRQPGFKSSSVTLGKAFCLLGSASLWRRREADNVQNKNNLRKQPQLAIKGFYECQWSCIQLE